MMLPVLPYNNTANGVVLQQIPPDRISDCQNIMGLNFSRERVSSLAKVHDLKTQIEPFEAVLSGRKNFELRRNDRDFAVGDVLILREYEIKTHTYTGRFVEKIVTYMINGGEWDLPKHLCVLGW
jgi:hypothetical protein